MLSPLITATLLFFQEGALPPILEVGKPVQVDLSPRESKTWTIPTQAGDRIEGFALQGGSNMDLFIANPAGAELPLFDFSSDAYEPFRFRASRAGNYRITVRNNGHLSGTVDLFLGLCELESSDNRALADQYLNTFPSHHPGMGFVGVFPNGESYVRAIGSFGADAKLPFTVESPIPALALELPLVQLSLLYLLDKHQIELSGSVYELADLPQLDPSLQLIHLLRGQAGLRRMRSLWLLREGLEELPMERIPPQVCNELLESQRELNSKAGWYSDGWYTRASQIMMQRICSQLSGQSYEELLNGTILPLIGMHATRLKPIGDFAGNRCFEWRWAHSSSTWIQEGWLELPQGDSTIETNLRDVAALVQFLNSDHQLAVIRSQHYVRLAGSWNQRSSGAPNLRVAERKSPEGVDIFYFALQEEDTIPDRKSLAKILELGEWQLQHPGRKGGPGPRGGRGTTLRPAEVTTPAAGKYYSSELDLALEIVARKDGSQVLSHPQGRVHQLLPTSSRWNFNVEGYFISSLRLGAPQGDGFAEFFLSLPGVQRLRFVRVNDSSTADD